MKNKILPFDAVAAKVSEARNQKKTIVTSNGCFDILHYGHLFYLTEARKLGDLLVVGVNSDESVRGLKGPNRPVIPEQYRAALVAGLEPVDYVFIFHEADPVSFLRRLKPDVHVKGGDYSGPILEQAAVEENRGRVCLVPAVPGLSTTGIIAKIIARRKTAAR
jgi:rfaE bifunctional protein nucleotidyltransferase chain/domain